MADDKKCQVTLITTLAMWVAVILRNRASEVVVVKGVDILLVFEIK